jgi:carbon-monoxide dehydrogenase medium subunit
MERHPGRRWVVIPQTFRYERAQSVEEALMLLAAGGPEAKLLAGGMSLLPLMKLRLASPTLLVDIARIPALKGVRREDGALLIGAATTYRELLVNPLVRTHAPLLGAVVAEVGDLQVRSRGTIGGALAHGDSASDVAAALLALRASIIWEDARGTEEEARAFFRGPFATALPEGAMLKAVRIPVVDPATRALYVKVPHPASGYPVLGVAVTVQVGPEGVVHEASIAVTGAADTPYLATEAAAHLVGTRPGKEVAAAAGRLAVNDGHRFVSDPYASADYRRARLAVETERALLRLFE